MRFNSHFVACITMALLPSLSFADVSEKNRKYLEQLQEMSQQLKQSSLREFLDVSDKRNWIVPTIYSAWYVNQMADDQEGNKKVERATRDFGLTFAHKLTETAAAVRASKNSPDLGKHIETMFRAMKWLGANPGYGNFILQARAQDIAAVAIAKLGCDLNYPFENVEALVKRMDFIWNDSESRRKILKIESRNHHFNKPLVMDAQKSLEDEWRNNMRPKRELGKESNNYLFVADDNMPNTYRELPETSWDQKRHEYLVYGFGSQTFRDLKGLLIFRKRVGYFPTKPKERQKSASESEIRAAFFEVWFRICGEKHNDPDWFHAYAPAARIYEDYISGTLCDDGEYYRSTDERFRRAQDELRKKSATQPAGKQPTPSR